MGISSSQTLPLPSVRAAFILSFSLWGILALLKIVQCYCFIFLTYIAIKHINDMWVTRKYKNKNIKKQVNFIVK
jgi:hypothetical protein